MDLSRALSFSFEDEHWQRKLGVLLLLSLVPGLNLIVWMGYMLSIAHNVVRGASRPLPEWQDWGDILARGLMGLAASLAFFAPALVALGVGAFLNAAEVGLALVVGLFVAVMWILFAVALLVVGHARFARSDQHQDYYEVRRRLRELREFNTVYAPAILIQFVLVGVVLLLSALLTVTLIGPFLVFMIASTMNGYLIGMTARQARRRPISSLPTPT